MPLEIENVEVVHNIAAQQFEIKINKMLCVLEYVMRGNRIIFTHTGVPAPLEGQGLANRMGKAAMEFAQENSYRVVPACQFMEVYIKRHPEYKSLLDT